MECNKEKALRAKDIAEKKMENKDFHGARKFALEAQQLYPELENITQMLSICDVHCSAEETLFGSGEMDWYKILQVEQTADDTTIKKQYRKFALQLHPDKNKFAGAEAAFKLIGEAQSVLLDKEERFRLDMYLYTVLMNMSNMSSHYQGSQMNFNPMGQTSVWPNFTNLNPQQQQHSTQPSQQQQHSTQPSQQQQHSRHPSQQQQHSRNLSQQQQCSREPSQQQEYSRESSQQQQHYTQPSQQQQHSRQPSQQQQHSRHPSQHQQCSREPSQQQEHSRESSQQQQHSKQPSQQQQCSTKSYSQQKCSREPSQQQRHSREPFQQQQHSKEPSQQQQHSRQPSQQQQHSREPSQQGPSGGRTTFWTKCSFCYMRYEYHMEVLNRSLRCPNCDLPFIAHDVDVQGTAPATHDASKVGVGSQSNEQTHKSNTKSRQKKGPTIDASAKPNGKRRRNHVAESNKRRKSAGNIDSKSEEEMLHDKDDFPSVSANRKENQRRSTHQKHQVPYTENVTDNDEGSGSPSGAGENDREEVEMNDQNNLTAELKGDKIGVKRKQNLYSEESSQNINKEAKEMRGKAAVEKSKIDKASEHSTSKLVKEPNNFVYPDPEFSDFDNEKKEGSFAAGQIWAIYDNTDGMPRSYALIMKVLSPGFNLQITWLEPNPDELDEVHWLNEQLPIACGKHKHGSTEITKDPLIFSHMIFCKKNGHGTYEVYPRKGETWALYKNWDIKWHMDAESHRQYDFEYVEILSDYFEGVGVVAAYLNKMKGFVSLFSQMEGGNCAFQISAAELFKFSHRVPSFKMTGQERYDVPIGSYELHPISSPMNLEEENEDPVDHIGNASATSNSTEDAFKIPDSVFYNFDDGRSIGRFQIGQIWAFYGDYDGLPKYYGQINKVRSSPNLELQVTHLSNYWLPGKSIIWEDKDMPITIGRFALESGVRPSTYTNTYSVSHQLNAITSDKQVYEIFPKKGEVWALYKCWTPNIRCSDVGNLEYEIVEIVGEHDLWIDVLPLELVGGCNTVFKNKSREESAESMKIYWKELLKFSHQIPAFKLTEEHGENLRGFWELDPRALPLHFFNNI